MKDISLIYDNSLLSPQDFIDAILHPEPKELLPTCDLKETPDFYYIEINSFYDKKHLLEISYKNGFLILKIMLNNINKEILFQRVFYLSKIDLDNILLHDHENSIELIVAKTS